MSTRDDAPAFAAPHQHGTYPFDWIKDLWNAVGESAARAQRAGAGLGEAVTRDIQVTWGKLPLVFCREDGSHLILHSFETDGQGRLVLAYSDVPPVPPASQTIERVPLGLDWRDGVVSAAWLTSLWPR